jgi:serine/threonine-protein kinase RsbT
VITDPGGRQGIKVIAQDQGPGIENLELALQDGFTSGGGLGLGLPGARRLVHEFHIETAPGRGTKVTLVMWERESARAA